MKREASYSTVYRSASYAESRAIYSDDAGSQKACTLAHGRRKSFSGRRSSPQWTLSAASQESLLLVNHGYVRHTVEHTNYKFRRQFLHERMSIACSRPGTNTEYGLVTLGSQIRLSRRGIFTPSTVIDSDPTCLGKRIVAPRSTEQHEILKLWSWIEGVLIYL